MKATIILTVLTAVLLTACSNHKDTDISGTYTGAYKNEYTIGNDTLEIVPYNGQVYQVTRRVGYQRIRYGKVLPKQFDKTKWMATYVQDKQVLQETEFGKQIYFKPGNQSLSLGETAYKRLK